MTPEEKVSIDMWHTLQELKEESLRTIQGEPISYWIDFGTIVAGYPMSKNIEKSLHKLEELGAIEIISSGWEYQ